MSNEISTSHKKYVDAVFQRISQLYGASTDADIGRKLGGLSNQSVYTYRKRDSVPYAHIIENCPPRDWEYIFRGVASHSQDPLDAARSALLAKGYRMILEPLPARPGPAEPPGEAEPSP